MGFRLFVLLEECSGDVFSMPWGVRGTLVSWANCSVGVPSCPAPPRHPAVRPDPTRPWYVRVFKITVIAIIASYNFSHDIPGHALHEKGLQGQVGDGTVVHSQERRAAIAPWISRLSTADKPRVLFLHRFT